MSSSTKKHSFPLRSLNMKDFFLPQLGKKKMVHSKNPFKVKPMFFPDEAKRPQKKLDGNLILFLTKAELPHEVVKADLSSIFLKNELIRKTNENLAYSYCD